MRLAMRAGAVTGPSMRPTARAAWSRRAPAAASASAASVAAPRLRAGRETRRSTASGAGVVARAADQSGNNGANAPPPSLSDLIAFESEMSRGPAAGDEDAALLDDDPTVRAQAIIGRATKVLEEARAALGSPAPAPAAAGAAAAAAATTASAPPSSSSSSAGSGFGGASAGPPVGSIAASGDLTRAVLRGALDRAAKAAAGGGQQLQQQQQAAAAATNAGGDAPSSSGMPAWASGLLARDDEDVFLNTPPALKPTPEAGGGGEDGTSGGGGGGGGGGSSATTASGGGGGTITTGGWPGASSNSSSGMRLGPALGSMLLAAQEPPLQPQLRPQLQQQLQLQQQPRSAVAFADDDLAFGSSLELPSQIAADAERARRTTELPPLQSVVELTSAFRPPERGGAAPSQAAAAAGDVAADAAAAIPAGRDLPDGSGVLPDGTRYEKSSGVEYGPNGYWRRWRTLRGATLVPVAEDGGPLVVGSVAAAASRAKQGAKQRMARVEFEETWWEASDYAGLRVMGAEKRGRDAQGGQWRERWEERLFFASAALDGVVERSAHKWARAPLPAGSPSDAAADEWEERWDEHYHASGRASKSADKWGKQGLNVWHERWGEDYDGAGACAKWTDKWAERLLTADGQGGSEQWGDKWHEEFADGRGRKNGEVWSVAADGARYQRWWGEEHPGGGVVRRHGHSTSGEAWDETVQMDTYYNPIPHFGYQLAVQHSPQLMAVPLRPRSAGAGAGGEGGTRAAQQGGGGGGGGGGGDDDDLFGPGLDAL